jgi:type IV secretory pathway VirD2 relaxase
LRAVVEHGGDPRRLLRPHRERKPTGRFNARGRGRQAAAALEGHGGWEVAAGAEPGGTMRYRARRVIVKARVVKLKGVDSQAIAAHLRYLQREGVTLDGNRGHAYSATDDQADAKAFGERGREDRHQFRFIVAAEDGVALGDLKPFTRELMAQMEKDLDTTLDWVAVDHYNTGHPHTHVVVRGVTDEGKILYIAGNYISHGIRARASDLVTRELGRQSELEVQQKLTLEVGQERFTRLDRTLLDEAQDGRVDLRISPHQSYLVRANRHLLISRLEVLGTMELAKPVEPGVWQVSPKLQPILTQMGERADTINLMHGALGAEAAHRSALTYRIHREVPSSPVTGHVVGKGLAGDGLGDKAYLVIDGVDAYVHCVELRSTQVPDEARIGAILTVGREPSARSVDKTIAAYAARNDGCDHTRTHLVSLLMSAAFTRRSCQGSPPEGLGHPRVLFLEPSEGKIVPCHREACVLGHVPCNVHQEEQVIVRWRRPQGRDKQRMSKHFVPKRLQLSHCIAPRLGPAKLGIRIYRVLDGPFAGGRVVVLHVRQHWRPLARPLGKHHLTPLLCQQTYHERDRRHVASIVTGGLGLLRPRRWQIEKLGQCQSKQQSHALVDRVIAMGAVVADVAQLVPDHLVCRFQRRLDLNGDPDILLDQLDHVVDASNRSRSIKPAAFPFGHPNSSNPPGREGRWTMSRQPWSH